jgi:hypothetical protein
VGATGIEEEEEEGGGGGGKGRGKKMSWPKLREYTGIFLDGLSKITKTFVRTVGVSG